MWRKIKYVITMIICVGLTSMALYGLYTKNFQGVIFASILGIMFYVQSVDYLPKTYFEEKNEN